MNEGPANIYTRCPQSLSSLKARRDHDPALGLWVLQIKALQIKALLVDMGDNTTMRPFAKLLWTLVVFVKIAIFNDFNDVYFICWKKKLANFYIFIASMNVRTTT